MTKTNAILRRPVNKLFPTENTFQEPTKRLWQGNKLMQEAAVVGKLKRKYEC